MLYTVTVIQQFDAAFPRERKVYVVEAETFAQAATFGEDKLTGELGHVEQVKYVGKCYLEGSTKE